MESAANVNAAEALVGQVLPGGWTVVQRAPRQIDGTGGNFSVNYHVANADGRRGFCKVLNYHWLLTARGADPVTATAHATRLYEFERDLAVSCVRMSRVVTPLAAETIYLEEFAYPTVSYIIFEAAERDIRGLMDTSDFIDVSVRLRSLHNLATGVRQLHGQRIAHQDIKPSNALVFPPDLSGQRITKIGDLGRASREGTPMGHDELPYAGDPAYAPPEGLYHSVPDDFGARRFGSDLYQIGSMIVFTFTASSMNAQLASELAPEHHWGRWQGTYQEVLPFLEDAFSRVLLFIGSTVHDSIRPQVISLLERLCEPDVKRRGDLRTTGHQGSAYSLERVVTRLDLLARRAEVHLRSHM